MSSQPLIARPFFLLQAEAACFLFASLAAYHFLFPHHWLFFACFCLAPDLSLLCFLRGPNTAGSVVYNLVHAYVAPVLLGVVAVSDQSALLEKLSLIWIAHISFDRMIAAGLKYPDSFRFTHIQSAREPK